jgi:hypothetical protein
MATLEFPWMWWPRQKDSGSAQERRGPSIGEIHTLEYLPDPDALARRRHAQRDTEPGPVSGCCVYSYQAGGTVLTVTPFAVTSSASATVNPSMPTFAMKRWRVAVSALMLCVPATMSLAPSQNQSPRGVLGGSAS